MARVSVDGGTDLRTPSQPKAQPTTIDYSAVDAAIMRYTADLSEVRISAVWEAIETAVPAVDSADDETFTEYIIRQLERLGFAASRSGRIFHRKHIDKKTPDEPHIRLLSKPEVLDRVPLSYPSIWAKMRLNQFPRSREVGGRSFWIEAEIVAWIAALPVRALKGEVGARPSLVANKSKVGGAKPSRLITNRLRARRRGG